jgi:hypothetical protein
LELGSSLSLVFALFIVSVGNSETVIQIKISYIIQQKINKQETQTTKNLWPKAKASKFRILEGHFRPQERMRGKFILRAKLASVY